MVHDPLDLTVLLEVTNSNARERSVDFQTLNENRLRNEAEGGHFLDDTVVRGLVKSHRVLGLVLDLALRPLLLFCGFSTA